MNGNGEFRFDTFIVLQNGVDQSVRNTDMTYTAVITSGDPSRIISQPAPDSPTN